MSLRYSRGKKRKFLPKQIVTVLILISIFGLLIYIWEYYVTTNNIPKRILPRPTDIADYFDKEFLQSHRKGYDSLLEKSIASFVDALIGFSISSILGTFIGLVFAKFRSIKEFFNPPFFALQLLPVPAFAPVVAAVLGYGLNTKILIVVLFTIYPFMIAAYDAVRNIPANYTALFKNFNASKIETFRELTLPALVPNLLHTMKIASTASIVASIIAELPLTVNKGIGKDIYNSFNNQLIPRVWVSLIIISIISLLFFATVSYLDKYINNKYRYGKF